MRVGAVIVYSFSGRFFTHKDFAVANNIITMNLPLLPLYTHIHKYNNNNTWILNTK